MINHTVRHSRIEDRSMIAQQLSRKFRESKNIELLDTLLKVRKVKASCVRNAVSSQRSVVLVLNHLAMAHTWQEDARDSISDMRKATGRESTSTVNTLNVELELLLVHALQVVPWTVTMVRMDQPFSVTQAWRSIRREVTAHTKSRSKTVDLLDAKEVKSLLEELLQEAQQQLISREETFLDGSNAAMLSLHPTSLTSMAANEILAYLKLEIEHLIKDVINFIF